MNIIIVGAGEIGSYVAFILSQQQHNITIIDNDKKKLDEISWQMDVGTRYGSGTDWQLLDDLLELSPHLFIALTKDDETNLVACSIAKHLGYPRTIARVKDARYFNRTRLDFSGIFAIDYLICPEYLVAHDIFKIVMSPDSLAIESFAHGAVQMRTLAIPNKWKSNDKPLKELHLPQGVMIGLIRRKIEGAENLNGNQVLFPHGDDCIFPGDEVTFIGETDVIYKIPSFFGITHRPIQSAAIAGGSLIARHLAKLLENRSIDIRIMEKDYDKCCLLAEQLPHCRILNHEAADMNFLISEKIDHSDVWIACTRNDETNLLTALLAKEIGCGDVIVMLSNLSYSHVANNLGLKHIVSPRVSAANHILSQLLPGKATSLVSLYDNQAEIIEINVSLESKIVGIPLSDLGPLLPKDFLIAMIQNRGRIMIAHGDRIISPGDTVVVITNPKHVEELEKIF
jgi:trk system potassium uptake protein